MNNKHTKDQFASFGESIYNPLSDRGWARIPKRELTLYLIHYTSEAGILDYSALKMRLANYLRVSTTSLQNLMRDILIRITPAEIDIIKKKDYVISILSTANQKGHVDINRGQMVFAIPDPTDNLLIESFFEELGVISDYKNSKKLLVLEMALLLSTLAKNSTLDTKKYIIQVAEHLSTATDAIVEIKKAASDKNIVKLLLNASLEQVEMRSGKKNSDLYAFLFDSMKKQVFKS